MLNVNLFLILIKQVKASAGADVPVPVQVGVLGAGGENWRDAREAVGEPGGSNGLVDVGTAGESAHVSDFQAILDIERLCGRSVPGLEDHGHQAEPSSDKWDMAGAVAGDDHACICAG